MTSDLGLAVSRFYEEIRDLLGSEFVTAYNGATYVRWTSVDLGSVIGFTLTLNQRALGPFAIPADYTWQHAIGNSSDPDETLNRAAAGQDPLPRQIPFNWDHRHTFNFTVSGGTPKGFSGSGVLRFASGQPYTPLPDYSRFSDPSQQAILADPTRYFAPRRIEVGLALGRGTP